MSFEDHPEFASRVADLNRYGQALNSCETVTEVVTLTIEALSLLFEFSAATFVEVRSGVPTVMDTTNPNLTDDDPGSIVVEAIETGETVVRTGEAAGLPSDSAMQSTLAVPASIVDDVVVVLVISATDPEQVGDEHVRPLEILASHAATAVSNIRSREQLERARNDLEKRKEMVEMYDRLLRHDLGNDLQVVTGFADVLVERTDGETRTYAEKIQRAAERSADLIQRVGDLVSTLEAEEEPKARDLAAILTETIQDVESQYPSLTVEFDRESLSFAVYAGDLLESVFSNVLSNAAVHNAGDVTVRVFAAETTPESVTVAFADDGDGIPPEISDDLFEMGRKGPDSSGTGFGLGFVRALVESYGGRVAVRESDAGGAEFLVTLDRV